jgi:copper chaperone CopZ
LKNKEVAIDVMVPSCSCCSGKLEQELAAAAGISEAEVRFVVPLRAQLRYDPGVARIDKIVGALKERGYGVALERAEFRIPHRPVMHPAVWKEKVRSIGEKFNGIISASINFTTSRIVVDYLPGLISASEIREAVLGWGALDRESTTKGVSHDEIAGIHGGGPEPERVRRDHFHALHSLGPGLSRLCDDPGLGGAPAGV